MFGVASIAGCIASTAAIKPLFKRFPNYKAFIIIGVASMAILKGMSVLI